MEGQFIEAQFEIDERMTEETKSMVLGTLRIMKPGNVVHLDVNFSRQVRVQNSIKANESLKFDNIKVSEFTVKNKDDNYDVLVHCYKPDNCRPDSPITVFFHGGGWTFNNVLIYSWTMQSLALKTESIWLSVEYRLSPEYKFPTGLNDCKYVLEHVLNNKIEFSTNNAKVGLSGDSSGGHYAALLANDYHNFLDYQILIYPCVHLGEKYDSQNEFVKDCYILVPDVVEFFIRNLFDEAYHNDHSLLNTPKVSPILKESFETFPKTLLIAAELDPLVDHSKKYHEKLQQFNVESELRIINGVNHGFFNHPVLMKNAFNEVQNYIAEFLKNF